MSYLVQIPKSIVKQVKKIPLPWRERVDQAMRSLANKPFLGIKMSGEYHNKRKIRVWPYRILYTFDQERKTVWIVEVGHRGHMSYK